MFYGCSVPEAEKSLNLLNLYSTYVGKYELIIGVLSIFCPSFGGICSASFGNCWAIFFVNTLALNSYYPSMSIYNLI